MRPIPERTPASHWPLTASMLRDIERRASIEAHHILGDRLQRSGGTAGDGSLLGVAYADAKAYEARWARVRAAV